MSHLTEVCISLPFLLQCGFPCAGVSWEVVQQELQAHSKYMHTAMICMYSKLVALNQVRVVQPTFHTNGLSPPLSGTPSKASVFTSVKLMVLLFSSCRNLITRASYVGLPLCAPMLFWLMPGPPPIHFSQLHAVVTDHKPRRTKTA